MPLSLCNTRFPQHGLVLSSRGDGPVYQLCLMIRPSGVCIHVREHAPHRLTNLCSRGGHVGAVGVWADYEMFVLSMSEATGSCIWDEVKWQPMS